MMFPVSRILEMRLFTDPKDGDYYKSVSYYKSGDGCCCTQQPPVARLKRIQKSK